MVLGAVLSLSIYWHIETTFVGLIRGWRMGLKNLGCLGCAAAQMSWDTIWRRGEFPSRYSPYLSGRTHSLFDM